MVSKQTIKAPSFAHTDIDQIVIGTKKTNKKVLLSYKSQLLIFKTCWLRVKKSIQKTPYKNISLLETLLEGDTPKHIKQFEKFIDKYELHCCQQVEKYGSAWFTEKNITIKSLIRKPQDQSSYLNWPIDLQTVKFIKENGDAFEPSNLTAEDIIKLIVIVPNLWIDKDHFGSNVMVHKIMVGSAASAVDTEYIFGSDSDTDDEDDNNSHLISLMATETKTVSKPPLPPRKHTVLSVNTKPVQVKTPTKSTKSTKSTKENEPVVEWSNDSDIEDF